MSSSFISKSQEKGFWADEAITQVVCWGIVNSIDSATDNRFSLLKDQFRDHLYDCSQGLYIGFTSFRFREYLTTPHHTEQMRQCIQDTESFFQTKGSDISTDEMNSFQKIQETKTFWTKPLSVAVIQKYLTYLQKVIDETIPWKMDDPIEYWD